MLANESADSEVKTPISNEIRNKKTKKISEVARFLTTINSRKEKLKTKVNASHFYTEFHNLNTLSHQEINKNKISSSVAFSEDYVAEHREFVSGDVDQREKEKSSINVAIKQFVPYQSEMLDSPRIKYLIALGESKKIKESELTNMETYVRHDLNAYKYPSVVDKRTRLRDELDKNEQRLHETIRDILNNESMKKELRTLSARFFELKAIQEELADKFSEQLIDEEQCVMVNAQIMNEQERYFNGECGLFSTAIRRLYTQDLSSIYKRGITELDVPYINNLSKLDEGVREEASARIAAYYMEAAEQLMQQHSLAESEIARLSHEDDSLFQYPTEAHEDERMPPLYMAATADVLNELLLNGADPIKESKDLSSTPLGGQFASRYVLEQSLNGANISIASVQERLKNDPAKDLKVKLKNEAKKLTTEVKKLTLDLKNNKKLIKAHIRAIVLRDSVADSLHYADISRSEKYQRIWNDAKQEVEKMRQTMLSESCTVHDFLTQSLSKLRGLPTKKLKSIAAKFPRFESLLTMQATMLANYHLVQGSSQGAGQVADSRSVQTIISGGPDQASGVNLDSILSKARRVRRDGIRVTNKRVNEKQARATKVSRLGNSTFFSVVPDLRPDLQSEQEAETQGTVSASRLNKSTLFFGDVPKDVSVDSGSKQSEYQPLFSY